MNFPTPHEGLVIRYSYLWSHEADKGVEEGRKDRPCAIVLMVRQDDDDQPLVLVLPVTHSVPKGEDAMELPTAIKRRLGLDDQQSWIILSDSNQFGWPGPDLRPSKNGDLSTIVYGALPPKFYMEVRRRFLSFVSEGRTNIVRRTE